MQNFPDFLISKYKTQKIENDYYIYYSYSSALYLLLKKLFSDAKKNIIIQTFLINFNTEKTSTIKTIFDILKEKSKEININIYLNNIKNLIGKENLQNKKCIAYIKENSNIKIIETKKFQVLHSKIITIDTENIIFTSANFTERAFTSNIEYFIYFKSTELAKKINQDIIEIYSK